MKKYDVAIIGGGAAGLAAAAELGMSSPELEVVVLEKNGDVGRKLRATGSGRCNITNTAAFGYNEIMAFFRRLGIVTRAYDNGFVYPYSESAADVVELLNDRMKELGITVITDAEVKSVVPGFYVKYDHRDEDGTPISKELMADSVILAPGGKAGPNYGTTGDGYGITRSLGHTVVTPVPVLTSVECREWDRNSKPCAITLGGIRARGTVSLYKDPEGRFGENTRIFEESGEIQFTKFGLSGICVFNMTRHMRYNRAAGESLDQFLVRLDLFADGDINEYLDDRKKEGLSDEHVLRTILKPQLAEYVLAHGAESIHTVEFHPTAIRGWKEAQATSGGVALSEIDPETSASLICPGLYIIGELLDYDGPCGGYNLSNAWLTAIRAAADITRKKQDPNCDPQ